MITKFITICTNCFPNPDKFGISIPTVKKYIIKGELSFVCEKCGRNEMRKIDKKTGEIV